jgi:hypothetical protein
VCAREIPRPLVKTRDFGMTPEGRNVEDFQIEPLPATGGFSAPGIPLPGSEVLKSI